jgi:UPF0755 protein
VVQPTREIRPPVRGRPRPTRGQLARRRAFALAGLLVVLAGLGLGAAVIARSVRHHHRAATPTVLPPPKPLRIIFPEGFTRREMAERIDAVDRIARKKRHVRPVLSGKSYLAATASSPLPGKFAGDRKPRNLEGFLFPATYDFTKTTTSPELVQSQLKAFRLNWAKVDLSDARKKNLTPYDVLIIASMVEREVLAPDERPKVAAVIYNRLHRQMPLGIDATIRYALDIPATQSLRESELHNPTPYNTRLYRGLPPGPIGNPGLASMQAAAHPAHVNYLYFVRKPDKVHHYFTASFDDFQRYAAAHGF